MKDREITNFTRNGKSLTRVRQGKFKGGVMEKISKIKSNTVNQCLNWRDILVCMDFNNGIFNKVAEFRRKFSRVFMLSFIDKESLRFNILEEIQEENAYQHVLMIAEILLAPLYKKADGKSEYMIGSVKDLLIAAILHCLCSDYSDKSMYGVLSFLSGAGRENGNSDISVFVFKDMIDSVYCSNEIKEIIRNAIKRINCLSKKEKKYVFLQALNALKIFEEPIMRLLSSSSDFCLNDFKKFNRPISLFVEFSPLNYKAFSPYFEIILKMIKYSLSEIEDRLLILNSKCKTAGKSVKSFEFLDNMDNEPSSLKSRDDFLFECSETTKPKQESRRWFEIPDEAYMASQDMEPIFISTIPDNDELEQRKKEKLKSKEMELIKYEDILNVNLFFNKEINEQINKLENILNEKNFIDIKERFKKKNQICGIVCMIFGEPGTGKTEMVLQLAKKTKRDLLKVDLSVIRKRYVGQSEKAIKNLFSEYKKLYDNSDIAPILFINEADGIFQKRIGNIDNEANTTLALDFNTIQNMILDKLECFEGIMIGTSNFIQNMDEALDRRILYKINIAKPDKHTQKEIWKKKIPELDDMTAEKLTDKFDFTGGIINNIAKKIDINALLFGENVNYENLEKLCKTEFNIKKKETVIGFCSK
ncbi:hypothetical protein R84B8_00776 [Treponema sp. R8-4-B8]